MIKLKYTFQRIILFNVYSNLSADQRRLFLTPFHWEPITSLYTSGRVCDNMDYL